jgi:hypothetical protein
LGSGLRDVATVREPDKLDRKRGHEQHEAEREQPRDECVAALAEQPRTDAHQRHHRLLLGLAAEDADDPVRGGFERPAEYRHDRRGGDRESDGEHKPIDHAVASLLIAHAHCRLQEAEPDCVKDAHCQSSFHSDQIV